ncbi:MAG: hypothetical protein JSS86_19725 [Cyanobacteria bacterium SZAS LIN-2]|nr:hypothetical protein [Cyanobacteria bacterium SZAS LIN-2]
MANNQPFDDIQERAQDTVADATNLSYGADHAAARLQNDVYQNYQQLGGGAEYGAYLNQVTASLKGNPAFEEVAAAWTSHNTQRFDLDGDGSLSQGEIAASIRTTRDPLEREILVRVRDQFQDIRHSGGDGFLGIRKDSLEPGDFAGYTGERQERRNQLSAASREQAQSRYLMQPLLTTDDGNPNHSLFRVLDNIKGGERDGNVSRGDLENFVKQYDRAAFNGGDVNSGVFTRANRDYAHSLMQNWDTPEVVALRGKHLETTGHYTQSRDNWYITESSLLAASGYNRNTNLYRTFETPKPQAKPERLTPVNAAGSDDLIDPYANPELTRQRAQFQQQLEQHVRAEAHYTVKQGQGFDRIARDVIRTHSNDNSYKSEAKVTQLSDHIARLNGREGRLDKKPVLKPGEDLQIFDNEWVEKQIQARMQAFDNSARRFGGGR